MKQVPPAELTHVAPIDYRGRRTRHTMLLIRARDLLLAEAARYFPGDSDREIARLLRDALKTYSNVDGVVTATRKPAHRNMQAPTGCYFLRSSSCMTVCRATGR